jgi:nicotinamidase-related amidase
MPVQRHPLPLLTRATRPFVLDRAHTCLLLQDLHAPCADLADGALLRQARDKVLAREFDEYADAVRLITPNIMRLLIGFRAQQIAVLYSCLGYRAGQPPSAFQDATGWHWDLDGPDGAFPNGWTPLADEPVFAKPGWGALANPELPRFLVERAITSVVVLGTMFETGIRQTCVELGDRGFGVLVVADGVAALTQAGHAFTAGDIAHGLTKLRTTGELLDLLARLDTEERVLI